MVFFRPVGGSPVALQPGTPNQPNRAELPPQEGQPIDLNARNPRLGQNGNAHALFAPGSAGLPGAAGLMESPQEAMLQLADAVYQRILMKINQASNPFMPPEQRMQLLAGALEDCENFIDSMKDGVSGASPNFCKMLMMRFKELHRSIAESMAESDLDMGRSQRSAL